MVSLRRHFVPNPVVIHSTCRGSRRRQPLSIHTRYDALGNQVSQSDPYADPQAAEADPGGSDSLLSGDWSYVSGSGYDGSYYTSGAWAPPRPTTSAA